MLQWIANFLPESKSVPFMAHVHCAFVVFVSRPDGRRFRNSQILTVQMNPLPLCEVNLDLKESSSNRAIRLDTREKWTWTVEYSWFYFDSFAMHEAIIKTHPAQHSLRKNVWKMSLNNCPQIQSDIFRLYSRSQSYIFREHGRNVEGQFIVHEFERTLSQVVPDEVKCLELRFHLRKYVRTVRQFELWSFFLFFSTLLEIYDWRMIERGSSLNNKITEKTDFSIQPCYKSCMCSGLGEKRVWMNHSTYWKEQRDQCWVIQGFLNLYCPHKS